MVKRGKVAVVGLRHLEEEVMSAFSRRFSTAIFFPVDSLRLSVGSGMSVKYGKVDLATFDYVLLLPDSSKKEFYYLIAKILEKKTKVSVSSETLFCFWNRPVIMGKLAAEGIPIRKLASISQNVAADFIKDDFKLPVILTTPSGQKIYVSNEKTLRNVLSLFSAGNMVSVQKPVKNGTVYVTFISEREAVGYRKEGDKRIPLKLDSKISDLGRKVRESLATDFCVATFICSGRRVKLSNIRLVPDFEMFKKVVGKDISRVMAEEITYKVAPIDVIEMAERSLESIGKTFDKFARWLGNEIGNLRAAKKKL